MLALIPIIGPFLAVISLAVAGFIAISRGHIGPTLDSIVDGDCILNK